MKQCLSTSLFILVVLFSSCKKDKEEAPAPAPQPDKDLTISLNAAYMPGSKIDSAIVSWEVNGETKTVKMQVAEDKLTAPLNAFTEGNGVLKLQLYSNLKFVYFSSVWLQEKQLVLKHKEAVSLQGPSGFEDIQWLPRVLLHNIYMKIFATVGLRPSDPYFFVDDAEKNYNEIWISREYWKTRQGLQKVAGGVWECTSNCLNEKGDILNTDFFKFLPTQAGTKKWDHIEIVVRYLTDPAGGGYLLDMNYTLPE